MSFRKERKYKLTIYEFNILKDLLVKKGMKKLYEPRKINSLYYDNELNEMFHHSEEGVLPRKKIRIRWYNTNFKSNLETKISSLEGRFKTTKPVCVNSIEDFPKNFVDQDYGLVSPSLLVSYIREYYSINSMRLTFDSFIEYTYFKDLSKTVYKDPEKVMEVKVDIDTADDYIETLIPYATVRFSKYSRGMLFSSGGL
ncbi:VTC domain-containing protein [Gammaproteobacteria bacterium]|nr:VTC domain-containing protein [Gammaproteobacteria bacterium]